MAAHLHLQGNLENLFEQFAPIDGGRRANAQATAAVHQEDLVGILGGEIQFMGDHNYGVAVVRREAAKSIQEAHLRGDVEMQRGLVEQQKQRPLRQGARENHPLLFSAGELVHPAITELSGADLNEGVLRNKHIVAGLETE